MLCYIILVTLNQSVDHKTFEQMFMTFFTHKIFFDFQRSDESCSNTRVSVQGVKSLGGHFACLCRGFDFYEVKKKMEILLHF